MKIRSVELMRNIRDRMSQEMSGMTWLEEQKYIKRNISYFDALLKEMPNKTIQPTPETLRVSGAADG